jgi:hypothetical protein
MYRIVAAFLLLVASVATSSAQGVLYPSTWRNQQGSILKVLGTDPATGNFAGIFINYGGICPGAVYDIRGNIRGPRLGFEAWRAFSPTCKSDTIWHGRLVNPNTFVANWVMTWVDSAGVKRRARGVDTFGRL